MRGKPSFRKLFHSHYRLPTGNSDTLKIHLAGWKPAWRVKCHWVVVMVPFYKWKDFPAAGLFIPLQMFFKMKENRHTFFKRFLSPASRLKHKWGCIDSMSLSLFCNCTDVRLNLHSNLQLRKMSILNQRLSKNYGAWKPRTGIPLTSSKKNKQPFFCWYEW